MFKIEVAPSPGLACIHRTGHDDDADAVVRLVYDVARLG